MTLKRRRPGEFDTFLFADYSGAKSLMAQRSAISLFRLDRPSLEPRKVIGPFTRETLRERLIDEIVRASQDGRRVLFGIDHQWSWPVDLLRAARVADSAWRETLATLVQGGNGMPPLGPPSKYAAAFNDAARAPVFHSRIRGLAAKYGIPSRASWQGNAVRLTETLMTGAKPSNRLGGVGAVAGQTMTGLVELYRLFAGLENRGIPVIAWPFDSLHDDGRSHVGCEIYPGFCKRELRERLTRRPGWTQHDLDAAAVCQWAASADLAALLDLRAQSTAANALARREGWILGAGERPLSSSGST